MVALEEIQAQVVVQMVDQVVEEDHQHLFVGVRVIHHQLLQHKEVMEETIFQQVILPPQEIQVVVAVEQLQEVVV